VQSAVIIGAGSESALSVLESCIKQATPTATPTTDDDVGVVSGGVAREVWGSELAALLSPTKTNTIKGSSSTPKRSPVSMETPTKRRRLDLRQSPLRIAVKTPPTVVPSKPVGPSTPLLVGGVKSSLGSKSGSPVGGAKAAAGGAIDPPPLTEKTDRLSQLLHEVKEIRRSYSTLAGSLLIIRRNQEDIKNRLTEIGLSVCSV
jgi:hypothetical protein